MTTSVETKPLYQRLKDEGTINDAVAQTLTNMTIASLELENERTSFDLHLALNGLLGALEVPAFPDEQEFWARHEGNAGTPTSVPLYQRLDEDPSVGSVVRNGLWNLLGYSFGIQDEATQRQYDKALYDFEVALGLPTPDARAANPDAFPNVLPV